MKILVTGGTGYIGSHTVLSLQEAGHHVVVIDNLLNSSEESLRRVAELSGRTADCTTWTWWTKPQWKASLPPIRSTP